MKWATRAGIHIDRAASAWLMRRNVDLDAQFIYLDDPYQILSDATPFDIRGVDLSHHHDDCSFETILRRYEIADPVLWIIAEIVHEADIDDGKFDAPEAASLDTVLRWLSLTCTDDETLAVATRIFNGLYEFHRQRVLSGREPS